MLQSIPAQRAHAFETRSRNARKQMMLHVVTDAKIYEIAGTVIGVCLLRAHPPIARRGVALIMLVDPMRRWRKQRAVSDERGKQHVAERWPTKEINHAGIDRTCHRYVAHLPSVWFRDGASPGVNHRIER